MKRVLSLFMVFALILSSAITVFGQGSDYETSWAKNEIDYMKEKKILSGYPDGTFRPNNNMTKAEFYKVINGLIGYTEKAEINFNDVKETDWFYEEVQKGVKANYIKEERFVRPNTQITREEVARILSIVFDVEEDKEAAKKFTDYNSIPSNLRGVFGGLTKEGYISGYPDGTVRPKGKITRAEIVKMLHNISGEIVNVAGTYKKDVKTNMVVNTADVILKDMTIEGNLYLTEGIGDGDITLDNVTVKGQLSVKGGGANSVIIRNSTINQVIVDRQQGLVRVVIENTTVEGVKTYNEVTLELKQGAEVKVAELDGKVQVTVEEGATVATLEVVNNEIVIEAKGDIESIKTTAEITVNGVKVEANSEVKVVEGKAPEVVTPVESTTPSAGGGGGGGGGGYTPRPKIEMEFASSLVLIPKDGEVFYSAPKIIKLNPSDATLTYKSNDTNILKIEEKDTEEGKKYYMVGVNPGKTTVTVTATKAGYQTTTVEFDVIVRPILDGELVPAIDYLGYENWKDAITEEGIDFSKITQAQAIKMGIADPDYYGIAMYLKVEDETIKLNTDNVDIVTRIDPDGNEVTPQVTADNIYQFVHNGWGNAGDYKIIYILKDYRVIETKIKVVSFEFKDEDPIIVDKTALQSKVDAVADLEETDYTEESWAVFEEALKVAEAVLAKEDATQEEVNKALADLNEAISGLEAVEKPGRFDKNSIATKKHGLVDGYIVDIRLTDDVTFENAKVEVSLIDIEGNVMQKNTLRDNHDVTGRKLTVAFDVKGSFDYEKDGYWLVSDETVYGNYDVPAKVAIKVTLANGKVLEDELTNIMPVEKPAWKDLADTSWYSDPSATSFSIYTAAELAGLAELVNNGTNFKGKTINLESDIDLLGLEWIPIGTKANPFTGKFNGAERTISNLKIDVPDSSYAGLFGSVVGGSLSNINLSGVSINAKENVGSLVGSAFTLSEPITNVHATNVEIHSTHWAGGLVGYSYASINNCSVDNVKITLKYDVELEDNGDKAGGITGYQGEGRYIYEDCIVKNADIIGVRDVGGIVGSSGHDVGYINCSVEASNIKADNSTYGDNSPYAGGILGRSSGNRVITLTNCTVGPDVIVSSYKEGFSGEFVGGPADKWVIKNIWNKSKHIWYDTIQEAISEAEDYNTILLSGSFEGFMINKPLNIKGGTIYSTNIPATSGNVGVYVPVNVKGVVLDGVKIVCKDEAGIGIETGYNVELTIRDSEISGFTTGIYLNPGSILTATGNTISDAVAGIGSDKANLIGAVSGNTFNNCTSEGIGLYLPIKGDGTVMSKQEAEALADTLTKVNTFNNCKAEVEIYGDLVEETSIEGLDASGKRVAFFETITDAVSNTDVATIVVGPGIYEEEITISKNLTLLGANSDIDPNDIGGERGEESILKSRLTLRGNNNITVKGFKFFNDTVGLNNQTAVAINGSGTYVIENCIFERDTSDITPEELVNEKNLSIRGIEISSAHSGNIDIRNNLFTGSDVDIWSNSSWRSAIYLNGGAQEVNIENNVFAVNRTALNLDDFSDAVKVSGNTFVANGTHISFGGTIATEGSYTISGNEFAAQGAVFNLSNVSSSFRINATENTYDGKYPNDMNMDELFELESLIWHKGKGNRNGFVRVLAGYVFVTPESGTLAQAIDVADEGDTILVAPGTYNLMEALTLGKSISIIGANADNTIIDVSVLSSGYAFPLTNNANLSVENFTFKGNNNVTGFRASSQTHVVKLEFINCVFEDFKYPIYLAERIIQNGEEEKDNKIDDLIIKGCTFNNLHHVYLGRGVVNSALIEGNTFVGNSQIGIEFYDCWTPRRMGKINFENNSFTNEYPIVLLTGGHVTINNTSITYDETPGKRINVAYVKAAQIENEKITIQNTEINGVIRDLEQIEHGEFGDVIIYSYLVPNEDNVENIENLYDFTNGSEALEEEIDEAEEAVDKQDDDKNNEYDQDDIEEDFEDDNNLEDEKEAIDEEKAEI